MELLDRGGEGKRVGTMMEDAIDLKGLEAT
jgi:hypothetical protein